MRPAAENSRRPPAAAVALLLLWRLLAPGVAVATVPPPRNPNSAKSCAICHYRWVDTFYIEGQGSDLVPYDSKKVVATPEMCMSCHDGSVVDSRKRMVNGPGHKTNVPPPAGMKIPDIFPLDDNGKIQCATCHTAHGVPSGPKAHGSIFMRTSNKNSAMCRMCHADKTGGPKAGNHPMQAIKKGLPRQLAAGYAKAGTQKGQIICESCHTAHGSPNKHFLVDATGRSQLCLACHTDKRSLTAEGRKRPSHVVNVRPVDVKIPDVFFKSGAKLGDGGVIICQTCHKVHNNPNHQPLLVAAAGRRSGFCLACHADKRSIVATRHNLGRSAPAEKNLAGQTVARAGVCSACHLPHGAARRLVGKKDYTSRLCLSCHSKGRVAAKINLKGRTHPLNVPLFTGSGRPKWPAVVDARRNRLQLPLFDRAGVPDKSGSMTCATCHNPHRAPAAARTARAAGKKAARRPGRSGFFLRKPKAKICRQCHRRKFSIAGSRHDLAKSAPRARNILHQTPAQSGLCGTCHLVHGARKGFLWARQATGGGVVGSLCFSCHNARGIAKKKVNHGYSHPMDIRPANLGYKVKGLPLFDKRGKRTRNGRITCHTCHDPHQWRPPTETRKTAKNAPKNYVAVTSFLRRQSPAICRDCHADKFQIAATKHDLARVAPEATNILNQTPARSGLCATCHLVHNAQKDFLWARKITVSGKGVAETLCVSCHNASGLAKAKVVGKHSHVMNIAPREKGLATTLPLYGPDGRVSPKGVLACPTCHNPHRWDPVRTAGRRAFKVQGDARNSFLRLENSPAPRLCINCHPKQGRVEKTDHDLLLSAASSKNGAGQTPAQSGTCGACHLVHNSRYAVKLCARDLAAKGPVMDRLCISCHHKGAPAAHKIPPIATHPRTAIVDPGKSLRPRAGHLPLFDPVSGRPVRVGNLSCPSCHNAHQWSSGATQPVRGVNLEGDATNSFLRRRARDTLCKDCHGPDGLFRYKFFHAPKAHRGRREPAGNRAFRMFRPARKP